MTQRARLALAVVLLLQLLVMGCGLYVSDTYPAIAMQPISWQCPTPSPVPTVLLRYDSNNEPPPTPTTTHPVYSTPVPTATPYIRTGSTYFAGQRIQVPTTPLTLTATRAGDQAVRVTIENAGAQPVVFQLDLGQVSTVQVGDHAIEGHWLATSMDGMPAQAAAEGWPSGTTTITIHFTTPGIIEAWGLPLVGDGTLRTGASGSSYVWWSFVPDPACSHPGGPPTDAYNGAPPSGAPIFGRAGWPVPPGTTISRGYGCSGFYTGVRAPQCTAGAPWWHNGIDFAGIIGMPITAPHAGRVTFAGQDTGLMGCSWLAGSMAPHTGYGNYEKIVDTNHYTFLFGHLAQLGTTAGATVGAGQPVGRMGSTGCSTAAHLHLTVIQPSGLDINPLEVLQPN